MVELRGYQQKFVADIRAAFRQHRRVLGVAPTGSGKTVCFSHITESAARKNKRCLLLVHRGLILDQIAGALDLAGVDFGRLQPGHPMTDHRVQIGMIQTVARRIDQMQSPDLIVIDEAHHAVAKSYHAINERWPNARILGVTATPLRLDGAGLHDVFDRMVLGSAPADLIEQGFLAKFRYYVPPAIPKIDPSDEEIGADGDYTTAWHDAKYDRPEVTGDVILHYSKYFNGAPALIFCKSIRHATHVAEMFQAAGFRAASIDGGDDDFIRRQLITDIGTGALNVLTSCALIGEGVDVPTVQGVIHLRRTKSLALKLQIDGRALRPKKDGSYAIILDHVGNATTQHHGLPDEPRAWTLNGIEKRDSEPSLRRCKECFRLFPPSPARVECPEGDSGSIPDDCLGRQKPPVTKFPIIGNGDLREISRTPDWAHGIDIVLARGAEYRALLAYARTKEHLREIADARGYKSGWIFHRLAEISRIPGFVPPK